MDRVRYLRPVSGCIRPWCVLGVTFALAGCFGLLTFVLLLANSSRMVCGMSGSNRTPCCRNQTHNNTVLPSRVGNRFGEGSFRASTQRRRFWMGKSLRRGAKKWTIWPPPLYYYFFLMNIDGLYTEQRRVLGKLDRREKNSCKLRFDRVCRVCVGNGVTTSGAQPKTTRGQLNVRCVLHQTWSWWPYSNPPRKLPARYR